MNRAVAVGASLAALAGCWAVGSAFAARQRRRRVCGGGGGSGAAGWRQRRSAFVCFGDSITEMGSNTADAS